MNTITFIASVFLILWSLYLLIYDFRCYLFTKKTHGLGYFPFLVFGGMWSIIALLLAVFAMTSTHWWVLFVSFFINYNSRFLTMLFSTWFATDKNTKTMAKHIAKETRRLSEILGHDLQIEKLSSMKEYFSQKNEFEKAIHDLYKLCMYDPMLNAIMEEFSADESSIRLIFMDMLAHGIKGWIKTGLAEKKFVPVAAITRPRVLHFLLRSASKISSREKCWMVNEFFEGNPQPIDSYDPIPDNRR